ncbi:BGN_3a_G0021190.mRNA.1.CDS.1 [Saccharomyces cerevisiae]|nr:BGN_3a_G0021190.mRNA.1.CDS.1 [Saccharomyces cerevisiae]CAI4479579.1 BGP_1a_G0020830.mRNA.1.CDS.1 [Saccharomyces cerevisiae]CAI7124965.1 BGP_1a_G0020830.mRNA.1.CDS.1 [Saccharomyces cerevisiae]CAI7128524.1 BGN_3a_G0021190.mRNA.1.CDS.1 [Saccharomyces cerevisiae]
MSTAFNDYCTVCDRLIPTSPQKTNINNRKIQRDNETKSSLQSNKLYCSEDCKLKDSNPLNEKLLSHLHKKSKTSHSHNLTPPLSYSKNLTASNLFEPTTSLFSSPTSSTIPFDELEKLESLLISPLLLPQDGIVNPKQESDPSRVDEYDENEHYLNLADSLRLDSSYQLHSKAHLGYENNLPRSNDLIDDHLISDQIIENNYNLWFRLSSS